MNEFITRHRIKIILAFVVAVIIAIAFLLRGDDQRDNAAVEGEKYDYQAGKYGDKKPVFVKDYPRDSISKNFAVKTDEPKALSTERVELNREFKTNNGQKDLFSGFDQPTASLNTEGFGDSKYRVENSNPKDIQGVYYVSVQDSVPLLFYLPPASDAAAEVVLTLPPNSAKHKLLGKKYLGFVSDVDIEQIGKSLTIINLETKEEQKIAVSDPAMRIASFFADPAEKKVVVAEEFPPKDGANFATSDTLHHKVWVYDLEDPAAAPGLIFDQKEDPIERWPIFWAAADNKIYFNSCEVVEKLHCNFGITRTTDHSDDREEIAGLEVGAYAAQPVLSQNGRHIAFVAWNGNQNTALYVKGDDKNNQFLNKNTIWVYDIKTGEKTKIFNFGDNQIIDHLFWAPDGIHLFFEMRQLTAGQPTSNSAGIWKINLITREFARVSPDITRSPGHLLSHFVPTPDGTGILFSVTKLFPKSTFLDPAKSVEKVEYFLRLSDMRLIELGVNVSGVLKSEPL